MDRMLEALTALGVEWSQEPDRGHYFVNGVGGPFPSNQELFPATPVPLSPAYRRAGVVGGEYSLSGVARMHERPIGDPSMGCFSSVRRSIISGARISPLSIHPGEIRAGGVVKVRGDVSSQFLTALLMALPLTGQRTTVEVVGELISKPYIAITLALMARFGVAVEREGWARFVIPGGVRYRSPGCIFVEGDASSASYFLPLARSAADRCVEGVGAASIQGDIRFAEALAQIGAKLEMGDNWIEASAPEGGRLKAFDMDLNHIPDAAMTLAVAALFADGPSRLGNIASWRVEETDRIFAMATELRKVGPKSRKGRITCASRRRPRSGMRRSIPMTTIAWRCASRWRVWLVSESGSTIRNA